MKIPDDVFETRCRYCMHGRPEGGNKDIPEAWIFAQSHRKDLSCNIFGIYGCDRIPGECTSFSPNHIFGICYTCEHDNTFHAGFCTKEKQPNKRQIFIGNGGLGGAAKPEYWNTHVLSTCDAYRPSHYCIDIMRRQAAEGRIPRNFDPETMKPIGQAMNNETAEQWDAIDRKRAEEAAAKEERKQAEQMERAEQLTLFSLAE